MVSKLLEIVAVVLAGAILWPIVAWAAVGIAVLGMLAASFVGGPVLYPPESFAASFTVFSATCGALVGLVLALLGRPK